MSKKSKRERRMTIDWETRQAERDGATNYGNRAARRAEACSERASSRFHRNWEREQLRRDAFEERQATERRARAERREARRLHAIIPFRETKRLIEV